MEYTQEITLDLNSNTAPPIIYTKQGDVDTRVLEIHLMENGNEYQPPADTFAVFRMRKPDGTTIGAGVDDDTTITSVGNNIVTVRLSEQALAAAGRGLADILLYNGDQYLSTASFILVIQPAPVAVMRGVVSSNEYSIFEDLLSSLGDTLPAVQSDATEAAAAASSAQYWANNFSLAAGSPMQPGADPSVTGTAPAYTLRLPSVKPMAAITIDETGVAASATVIVEDFPEDALVPAGLNSDLIKVFNFGITLPSGRNVQIDDTLSESGQAADAAAAGAAIGGKYTKPSNGIPLSDLASSYIIPIEHGGIGVSIDTTNPSSVPTAQTSACTNIGAQRAIQSSDVLISSSNWNGTQTVTKTITNPNGIPISDVPNFVASPAGPTSWQVAMDIGLYPPIGSYTPGNTTWDLTWTCEESAPSSNINITVYWW